MNHTLYQAFRYIRLTPALLIFVLIEANGSQPFHNGTLREYSEPFIEGTEYHFVYVFDESESFHERCERISVKGAYVQKYWDNDESGVSKSEHLEAMQFLSKKNNQKVSFGIVGDGLQKLHSCRYFSRGLRLEADSAGTTVYFVGKRVKS